MCVCVFFEIVGVLYFIVVKYIQTLSVRYTYIYIYEIQIQHIYIYIICCVLCGEGLAGSYNVTYKTYDSDGHISNKMLHVLRAC